MLFEASELSDELNRRLSPNEIDKLRTKLQLTDEEYQTWQESQDKEYWFRVWTTKEAILKASGLGIRLDLNSLNTQVHPEQSGGMCTHPLLGTFAYQNFILNQRIVLTVAWRAEQSCRGFQFPQIQVIRP